MNIRIITDSTSDIPQEQALAEGITIVPLSVFFGEEAYRDGVDLDNAGFYAKLQASKAQPRTSQPSPAAFQQAYTDLINEGADAILSVHLSSKLSGTYQSACTARDSMPEEVKKIPIEIIDSRSVSAGMGLPVIHAARMAREGKSLEEIKAKVEDELARTNILAVLDTLEFLKRSGRVTSTQAIFGSLLSVKLVISVRDGEVIPIERPRTRSKAFARLAQLVSEMGKLDSVTMVESDAEVGRQMNEVIKPVYSEAIPSYKLGAVIGTHTGPGTVGFALVTAK